jgi:uncharacterized damage-inducible protein DinB
MITLWHHRIVTNWTAPEVDPPAEPTNAGERESLEGWLAWHRNTLLRKCQGLTGEELGQRSVEPSTLSLHGLIRHMSDVERAWFRERVLGEDIELRYSTRENQDGDFDDTKPEDAEQDYATLLAEIRLANEGMRGKSLEDTFQLRDRTFNVRWVYLHMIEEYARHNGHADLLRERIDGETDD